MRHARFPLKTSSATTQPRTVREHPLPLAIPAFGHPEWAERFPWLVQGTTARGNEGTPFDLRLFGREPVAAVLERWRALRRATACPRAVHAYQVHGARVLEHRMGPEGLLIADDADGHVTAASGTLLTVSVADCVPVFLVAPERRVVAALHAGWRGVAAGVIEAGVDLLRRSYGVAPDALHVHLGPAICGECYEVGPEVHEALRLPRPDGNMPVDLRKTAARRAEAVGVRGDRITVSAFCTRCGDSPFFSHRAGCTERQVGFIGMLN